MPISIKNAETETLLRQLSRLTGESLTDTVHRSLEERYQTILRERGGRTLADELLEIGRRCGELPIVSNLPGGGILGSEEPAR